MLKTWCCPGMFPFFSWVSVCFLVGIWLFGDYKLPDVELLCCVDGPFLPTYCILASTCFGSSLPSSGSFLDPSELLEIQIEWVVYHIVCGYVACVPDCRGSDGTTQYMICHPFDLYFK
jgi:hypothetical protein